MIKAHYHIFLNLRTGLAIILLLLISFKIVSLSVTTTADVRKEFVADTDDNDSNESKVKPNLEQKFIEVSLHHLNHSVQNTPVIHYTAYFIKYMSLYYNNITVPPPDADFQIST